MDKQKRPSTSVRLKGAIEVAEEALKLAWREICIHEETHRGGAIWTICDYCGRQWADDEGGMKPNPMVERLEKLEEKLAEIK